MAFPNAFMELTRALSHLGYRNVASLGHIVVPGHRRRKVKGEYSIGSQFSAGLEKRPASWKCGLWSLLGGKQGVQRAMQIYLRIPNGINDPPIAKFPLLTFPFGLVIAVAALPHKTSEGLSTLFTRFLENIFVEPFNLDASDLETACF
jgi:hypothetical protein